MQTDFYMQHSLSAFFKNKLRLRVYGTVLPVHPGDDTRDDGNEHQTATHSAAHDHPKQVPQLRGRFFVVCLYTQQSVC